LTAFFCRTISRYPAVDLDVPDAVLLSHGALLALASIDENRLTSYCLISTSPG
jgi:hypothetical protein